MRTVAATPRIGAQRMAKAEQFAEAARVVLDLAEEADDVGDAFVTLAVHAGIAAADGICIARLGKFSRGENHDDAVGLLRDADSPSAKHLSRLLQLKTKAGYSPESVSARDRVAASRAMDSLLRAARASRG